MKKIYLVPIVLIMASIGIGIYLYPLVPAQMASHWDAQGNVNGYVSRFWGLFLVPALSVFLFLLFMYLPHMDPLKKNIEEFRFYYDNFIVIFVGFLFYIHILTLAWNRGYAFNMMSFLIPALSVLFYYIGVLLGKSKQNFFIGIRTPWTLSSKEVWDKTHERGSVIFRIAAVLILLGLLLPKYAMWILVISIIFAAVYCVVYSYVVYRRIQKK